MPRVILHSDYNSFYCAVEELYNPALREVPMAVTGNAESRHGIVLSKNQLAKRFGIKTGEALWQARKKCADIVFVTARHGRYSKFSRAAREIYEQYTDQVEPFGADEAWLDVTGSTHLFGSGKKIADEIRATIRCELGLNASVGVSFNKVFAKLGSDMNKPNATTVITTNDYKEKVWPIAAKEMIFIGPATTKKLARHYINTIGDIATCNISFLKNTLGVHGETLWSFANGLDASAVNTTEYKRPAKSIGNSTTAPHDLDTPEHIKISFLALCESVASQLREQGFKCKTVQISIRTNDLTYYERQTQPDIPTSNASDLLDTSLKLFYENKPEKPVRSLGVRASGLIPIGEGVQLSIFPEHIAALKQHDLECAIDRVRDRFGYTALRRGVVLIDEALDLDANGRDRPNSFLQR